ncbi:hypothetical protein EV2_010095 [Malus domestica]
MSLSASQVLERNGLDLLGACLNDLGADGRLSGDAIVRASSALERVRETISIFQTALKAEQDLQAATAVQDTLRPKIDTLKVKGEALAELDHQMAKLAKRRSAIASDLAKDFESGGKDYLTEYAATTKRVERLKLDKKNRQAEVIMGEVRWLELEGSAQHSSTPFPLNVLECKPTDLLILDMLINLNEMVFYSRISHMTG